MSRGASSNGHSAVTGEEIAAVRSGPASRATLRSRLPRVPTPATARQALLGAALTGTGTAAMRLQKLTGREVIDLEVLQEMMGLVYRLDDLRRRHRGGDYQLDDFGFDPDFTEAIMPLARIAARKYWRVDIEGQEHIPATGAALMVSNHAGVLPWDGAMIKVAVFDAVERHLRALIAAWFGSLPGLSWFMRRTGQTLGHPDDSLRLLRAGELVLVFPEGVKGTGKPWSERYRLRRFGRGGFVNVALRAAVPIIPVSVVGSEETYPMLANLEPVAAAVGMPYFPITPTWPWLGPLGFIPLPSKWRITFHPPLETRQYGPVAANDAALVMRLSDEVREIIQGGVVTNLMERVRTFRG